MEKETEKQARVRDLFVWQSQSHPLNKYPPGAFPVFGVLALIISIVLALFQEWLGVAVTWAAYFLFFALTKIPQVSVEHKITTEGIISINHSYLWQELGPFWFKTRNNETVLHIANRNFLGHLIMLIDVKDQEKIREILAEYLPFIEVPEKSFWDKFFDRFSSVVKSA